MALRVLRQTMPDTDVTETGARFNSVGYTSFGHVPRLVAPDRSGLYYVHLETEVGEHLAMPLVVAPATPTAPVAVLAATINWNAYNRLGGRSNYINEAGLPPYPVLNGRQDLVRYVIGNSATQVAPNGTYPPLSFDRPDIECGVGRDEVPTDPLSGRIRGSLAPCFWRLLAWLEREGFEHDVYAVFSAGSMTYIPALLLDDALSTTANVVRRMTTQ
ncbi:MAG TPA: hypothetical protein PKM36_06335 [Propionibacteriaceae bacterium]|nr:hypothetical protein [Propionibacteriaceae bacterium]HPZ50830.1 hypothetical protein [Propionibacteriaceae bacterium]